MAIIINIVREGITHGHPVDELETLFINMQVTFDFWDFHSSNDQKLSMPSLSETLPKALHFFISPSNDCFNREDKERNHRRKKMVFGWHGNYGKKGFKMVLFGTILNEKYRYIRQKYFRMLKIFLWIFTRKKHHVVRSSLLIDLDFNDTIIYCFKQKFKVHQHTDVNRRATKAW